MLQNYRPFSAASCRRLLPRTSGPRRHGPTAASSPRALGGAMAAQILRLVASLSNILLPRINLGTVHTPALRARPGVSPGDAGRRVLSADEDRARVRRSETRGRAGAGGLLERPSLC